MSKLPPHFALWLEPLLALVLIAVIAHAHVVPSGWRGTWAAVAVLLAALSLLGLLHALGRTPQALRHGIWPPLLGHLMALSDTTVPATSPVPRARLQNLATVLQRDVIGQPELCRDLAEQLRIRLARTARRGPAAVFVFAAPPHSGKRWVAHCVDRALYDAVETCTLDLSPDHATLGSILGQPPAPGVPGRRGELTTAMRERPARVIVLRGIAEARSDLQLGLLRAWRRGQFFDGFDGSAVGLRDAIFVVAVDLMPPLPARDPALQGDDHDAASQACKRALRERLPSVLHESIDRFLPFRPLDMAALTGITARRLQAAVAAFGLDAEPVDPTALQVAIAATRPQHGDSHTAAAGLLSRLESQLATLRGGGVRRVRIVVADGRLQAEPA